MTDITIQVPASEQEILPPLEEEQIIEAVEAVSDNEVIIASIEAEKEIAIAEIHAEARVAEAEAFAEAQEERPDLWETINRLSLTVETLAGEIAKLQTPVEPPLSLEEAEAIVESSLTPPFIADPTNETQTEVIEKSGEESLIPPLVEVKDKPIIRLV